MNIFEEIDGNIENISVKKLQEIQTKHNDEVERLYKKIAKVTKELDKCKTIIGEDYIRIHFSSGVCYAKELSIEDIRNEYNKEISMLQNENDSVNWNLMHAKDEISQLKGLIRRIQRHINSLLDHHIWVPYKKIKKLKADILTWVDGIYEER